MRGVAQVALAATVFFLFGSGRAADLDPKALAFKLQKDIQWTGGATGPLTAVMVGDPSKPGLYIVLTKWRKNMMSRPHSHPNDRFITVLSGTWWCGTGPTYDPASTVPMPPGTFVTHFAKGIHYDGAKDEDTVLQIVGIGPAESSSTEAKQKK
jgi:hypothetical protein